MLAALFAAFTVSAATVTLNPAEQTAQTTETDVNVTIDGVTIAYHGTLNATDFRVYGGQTLTLSASQKIESIVINGYSSKANFAVSELTSGTATVADYTTTAAVENFVNITGINASSVSFKCDKQLRATLITVTLGEGGDDPDPSVDPSVDPSEDPSGEITVAEALAIINALTLNDAGTATAEDTYTVVGYVTEIEEDAVAAHGNVTLYIADEPGGTPTLYVYRAKAAACPTVGAKVQIEGSIMMYKNKPETAQGAQLTVLEGEVVEPTVIEATVAEALAVIDGLADGATTSNKYQVTGYVISISEDGVAEFGNMTFVLGATADAEDGITVYRGKTSTLACVGAKVTVLGALQRYVKNEVMTPEFATGATVTIVEQGECSSLPGGDQEFEATEYLVTTEYFEEYGAVGIQLANTEENIGLVVWIYPDDAENLDGEYTSTDEDNVLYPTWDDENDEGTDITSATISYTTNEDGTLTIVVVAETADGSYKFTYDGVDTEAAYAEPEEAQNFTPGLATLEYVDTYISYGEVFYYLYTEDGQAVALGLVSDLTAVDENAPLPVGEYGFSDNPENALWAGEIFNGSPYPSFFFDGDHYYYLVSGSVVVTLDEQYYTITIDATTQNGSTVKATYQKALAPTALNEVEAELDANAPVYNVLGQRVSKDFRGIVIQNGKKFLVRNR